MFSLCVPFPPTGLSLTVRRASIGFQGFSCISTNCFFQPGDLLKHPLFLVILAASGGAAILVATIASLITCCCMKSKHNFIPVPAGKYSFSCFAWCTHHHHFEMILIEESGLFCKFCSQTTQSLQSVTMQFFRPLAKNILVFILSYFLEFLKILLHFCKSTLLFRV